MKTNHLNMRGLVGSALAGLIAFGALGPAQAQVESRVEAMPEESVFSRSLRFSGPVVETLPDGRSIRETAIWRGQKLTWRRKVENRRAAPEMPFNAPDTTPDLDSITVEQLAENLRPLVLFGGHEFIGAAPDLAAAQRMKDSRTPSFNIPDLRPERALGRGPSQGRGGWIARPAAIDGPVGQPVGTRSVHGTDDRSVMSNTVYPHRTHIVFDNTSTNLGINGSQGSGTLIGPSTAMSVAHVFWDEVADDWEATHRWAPGFDSEDADSSPYGDWVGCYVVAIPGAYPNNINQNQYDYAVLDFDVGCNSVKNGVNSDEPGNSVGWLGWYTASTSDIEGKTGYVRGYPGLGTCGDPGIDCDVRVWGDTSSAAENDRVQKEIRHQADTSGGMSGSAFYHYADPSCGGCDYGPYVVGMHRAGSANYNLARRLGGKIATFIENNSSDY